MTVDSLWQDLFEKKPSALEERVMTRLVARVGEYDFTVVASAILVRFLSEALIEDEASPIRIVARGHKALEGVESSARALARELALLRDNLHGINVSVASAEKTLDNVRRHYRWERGNLVTLFDKDYGPDGKRRMVPLGAVGAAVALVIGSTIVGGVIVTGIALMIFGKVFGLL